MARLPPLQTLVDLESGTPDLKFIAQFLRDGEEITPEIRIWLANLFDPPTPATDHVVLVPRRGRKRGDPLVHEDAVNDFYRRIDKKNPHKINRKSAVYEAAKKHGIGESTLEAAIKSLRAVDEIDNDNRPDHEMGKIILEK